MIRRQKVVDFLEEGHDGATLLPWPDWPPMRCAYCATHQRWVYGYDHYCPLVGNAVGERNRPRFFLLLLSQTILNSKAAFTMEAAVAAWRDVSGGGSGPWRCFWCWPCSSSCRSASWSSTPSSRSRT